MVEQRRPEPAGLPVQDRDRRRARRRPEHHVVEAEVPVDDDQGIDERPGRPGGCQRGEALDQSDVLRLETIAVCSLEGLDRRRDRVEQHLGARRVGQPRPRSQLGVVPQGCLELDQLGEGQLGLFRRRRGDHVADLGAGRQVVDHERDPPGRRIDVAPMQARHRDPGLGRDLAVEADLVLVEPHGDADLAVSRLGGREFDHHRAWRFGCIPVEVELAADDHPDLTGADQVASHLGDGGIGRERAAITQDVGEPVRCQFFDRVDDDSVR